MEVPVIGAQDLQLVAVGAVIWIVALSVAVSFYLPVFRAEGARSGGRTSQLRSATRADEPPPLDESPPLL